MSEILCIIPGPKVELKREPLGEKWCFLCRKRLPHDLVVKDYNRDSPHYSYYDPIVMYECSRCKQDHTDFPGSRL